MSLIITGIVDEKTGKLPELVRKAIGMELARNMGKPVRIEIKRATKIAHGQWGYLYGVVYPIIQAILNTQGEDKYSIADIDASFKNMYWYEEYLNPVTERMEKRERRKRAMNRTELADFTERVITWETTRLHADIPPPPSKAGESVHIEETNDL